MQAAKKLVLLDEQDIEYKRLQRPTAAVDLSSLAHFNDRMRYLITCIDVFSK